MIGDKIAALVLAGGKALRMGGGDKPLLTVGNRSMLAAVVAALDVPHIAISANGDPSRFGAFGLTVLSDGKFHGQGPLAGILAGLDWAASLGMATLLTAPGDTPFLPRGLDAWLAPAPCCVASQGQRHHLIALWPVSCADALRDLLSVPGPRHVARFAESIGMRYREYGVRTDDLFANINTQNDLIQARTKVRSDADRAGTEPGNG